jgi:hypothetical protein
MQEKELGHCVLALSLAGLPDSSHIQVKRSLKAAVMASFISLLEQ